MFYLQKLFLSIELLNLQTSQPKKFYEIITIVYLSDLGGSMAEWSVRWTRNQAVPGPALTTSWICFALATSSNP